EILQPGGGPEERTQSSDQRSSTAYRPSEKQESWAHTSGLQPRTTWKATGKRESGAQRPGKRFATTG
ncbi:unnamed protein product, partial [Rotaria sp. Silwood2]